MLIFAADFNATSVSLLPYFDEERIEAGCDEAGRGCLAGPVFAAAVILPKDFQHPVLNDSKQLTHKQREELRPLIEEQALAWAVAKVDHLEIDRINILNASFLAMHKALNRLSIKPKHLIIDGNRFKKYKKIPHRCIIEGDGKYFSIAAASVLAKTYRDDFMQKLHKKFPLYHWDTNKGYGTPEHREAIELHGINEFHRKTFRLYYGTEEVEPEDADQIPV
jgi:ribonuclease HII